MTDEQLVNYVEDRVEKARSEGFNEGFSKGKTSVPKMDIESILEEISKIKGIGMTRCFLIQDILTKHLI